MGILKELENIAKDVEKSIEDIGDDIEKDLEKATQAVQDGLNKAEKFITEGLDKAEKKLVDGKIDSILKNDNYKSAIDLVHNLIKTITKDPNSIINDVEAILKADTSQLQRASDDLKSLVTTSLSASFDAIKKTNFETVSVGANGEINLVIGLAASGGIGYKFIHDHETRLLVDMAVSTGAEEAVDAGIFIGCWRSSPKHLKGGYLSVNIEGGLEAGIGLALIFDISSDPDFGGFIVSITGGEELEFGIELGFTLPFKVDSLDID